MTRIISTLLITVFSFSLGYSETTKKLNKKPVVKNTIKNQPKAAKLPAKTATKQTKSAPAKSNKLTNPPLKKQIQKTIIAKSNPKPKLSPPKTIVTPPEAPKVLIQSISDVEKNINPFFITVITGKTRTLGFAIGPYEILTSLKTLDLIENRSGAFNVLINSKYIQVQLSSISVEENIAILKSTTPLSNYWSKDKIKITSQITDSKAFEVTPYSSQEVILTQVDQNKIIYNSVKNLPSEHFFFVYIDSFGNLLGFQLKDPSEKYLFMPNQALLMMNSNQYITAANLNMTLKSLSTDFITKNLNIISTQTICRDQTDTQLKVNKKICSNKKKTYISADKSVGDFQTINYTIRFDDSILSWNGRAHQYMQILTNDFIETIRSKENDKIYCNHRFIATHSNQSYFVNYCLQSNNLIPEFVNIYIQFISRPDNFSMTSKQVFLNGFDLPQAESILSTFSKGNP